MSIQAIFHGVATAMNRVCQTKSGSSSVLIFVIALAVRLLAISILSPHKAPQHYEIDRIAISFSRGDGLSNPFPTATGPSALYTPAYPLLLSIIYYLLGTGPEAELAKLLFNAIGSSLWLSLLPFASVAAGAGPLPGVTAGLFGAMLPLHLWTDLRGKDAPWTATVMLAIAIGLLKLWKKNTPQPSAKMLVALACLGGVGVLLNASMAAVLSGWMLATIWRFRNKPGKALRFVATYLAVVAAVMLPWIMRNYHVFHSFVPLRSNLGLELWIGNNPLARPTFYENDQTRLFELIHPLQNAREAQVISEVGEVEYSRRKMIDALQWIQENPGKFLSMTVRRIALFWFPPAIRPVQAALLYLVMLLSMFGLWRARKGHSDLFLLVGSLWVFFPLLYYLVQVEMRYRYPIYWSILLTSFYAVVDIARLFLGKRTCSRM